MQQWGGAHEVASEKIEPRKTDRQTTRQRQRQGEREDKVIFLDSNRLSKIIYPREGGGGETEREEERGKNRQTDRLQHSQVFGLKEAK